MASNKKIIKKHSNKQRGFSNTQTLMFLLVSIPAGLIGLGFIILILQRNPPILDHHDNHPETIRAPKDLESKFDDTNVYNQTNNSYKTTEESRLTVRQARGIVEEWLRIKPSIFAPPYSTKIADKIVANGPLWQDLTKPKGSIMWLKENNIFYSYPTIKLNNVIRFKPSKTRPEIILSITETSIMHSPKGNETSSKTNEWIYILTKEAGEWKIWDYKKVKG